MSPNILLLATVIIWPVPYQCGVAVRSALSSGGTLKPYGKGCRCIVLLKEGSEELGQSNTSYNFNSYVHMIHCYFLEESYPGFHSLGTIMQYIQAV